MAKPVTEPKDLLRKKIDDPEVTAFFKALDPKTKTKLTPEKEPRWNSERAGLLAYSDKNGAVINTVFLYAEGYEDYKQFSGPIPHGLTFSLTKPEVQAMFKAPPDFTSSEHDTWDFDDYRLIVDYQEDSGAIATITLTTAF